jgi:drug/metabolite transporter (DMT)-like permease
VSCLVLIWSAEKRRQVSKLPASYLIGCGLLFIGYMLLLFLAVGLADTRQQVLEVGLLNYLWPSFTILLTVLLLTKTARWLILPGTILALAGMFLVLTQGGHVSWHSFSSNLAENPIAYLFGFTAAISWALYSVLTRKWAGGQRTGAVELFLVTTAASLLLICYFIEEPRAWNLQSGAEIVILGLATYLAYGFWDTAMRKGNVVLLAAGSYLTPLFSTIVSCIYLAVTPKPILWVGCVMLVAGSLISWYSVKE